ncbi:MAG: ROK family protein [Bacteroidota bacterium]
MYLGLDIGGTNIKTGVLNTSGELIFRDKTKTKASDGVDSVINLIESIIRQTLDKYPNIETIGIGVPGVVDYSGLVKIAPNLPGWENIALKERLANSFGKPLAIDNDANAAAVAELKLGAGVLHEHFLFITLGTGVGGTIIYNGKIFGGANGNAGEVGHTIIDYKAPAPEGKPGFRAGVLEEFIGRTQIIQMAKGIIKNYPDSLLHEYEEKLDVVDISNAVDKEDRAAIKCFEETANYLGTGLATILNILDLNTIIIGGGISRSNKLLFEKTEEVLKNRALPSITEKIQIKIAKFNNEAGIIGAALIGREFGR